MSCVVCMDTVNNPWFRKTTFISHIFLAVFIVFFMTVGECTEKNEYYHSMPQKYRTVSGIGGAVDADYESPEPEDYVSNHDISVRWRNFNGFEMVTIPEGAFRMGSDSRWADVDEVPVHTVHIDSFAISAHEMTNSQTRDILQWAFDHGLIEISDSLIQNSVGAAHTLINPADSKLMFESSRFVVVEEWKDRPCTGITWFGAQAICNFLSVLMGLEQCIDWDDWTCDFTRNGFRLPTEAEWEFACRAGTESDVYTGDIIHPGFDPIDPNLDEIGWYYGNLDYRAHDIGLKMPNDFGLYDMIGNVWEWCYDLYGRQYYRRSPLNNPRGPGNGIERVKRGGSCFDIARSCRSSFRSLSDPSYSYGNLGFRPALSKQYSDSRISAR